MEAAASRLAEPWPAGGTPRRESRPIAQYRDRPVSDSSVNSRPGKARYAASARIGLSHVGARLGPGAPHDYASNASDACYGTFGPLSSNLRFGHDGRTPDALTQALDGANGVDLLVKYRVTPPAPREPSSRPSASPGIRLGKPSHPPPRLVMRRRSSLPINSALAGTHQGVLPSRCGWLGKRGWARPRVSALATTGC